MAKSENFGLQGGAGPKTRSDHGQNCDQKRVSHADDYGLTNGRKLRVFRLDGVFGNDRVGTLLLESDVEAGEAEGVLEENEAEGVLEENE